MEDETEEKHESYGLVGFYRRSGGSENLFGSSIRHGTTIALQIKTATRKRNLSNYWIHGDKTLIELVLSANQFANLLTSMNCGDGIPCTLKYVMGKRMADPPTVEQRELFEQEFKRDVDKATKSARSALSEIKQIFDSKASIGKADRAEILDKIQRVVNLLTDSIPFVQSQFNEAMDKTVSEARAEVDSFIETKIHSLGIDALNSEVQAALSATKQSPALLESK